MDQSRLWDVKTFTDNIVLGYPVLVSDPDGETKLGRTLMSLIDFQWSMVRNGFFLRGGMSIGGLYMDQDIVWGKALIDAHELESVGHGPPGIMLGELGEAYNGPTILAHVLYQLGHYGSPCEAPQNEELFIDCCRDRVFVDYLSLIFSPESRESVTAPNAVAIERHKGLVEKNLQRFPSESAIGSKYAWVGAYHNFCCYEKLLIDPQLLVDSVLIGNHPPTFTRFGAIFPTRKALAERHPFIDKGRRTV